MIVAAVALTRTLTASAHGDPLQAIAGAWFHGGDPAQAQALEQAIERATSGLGWAYRGAVRAYLRARIEPAHRIDVRWRHGELRIERDGRRREPLPLRRTHGSGDGAWATLEPDGSLLVHWTGRLAAGSRRYQVQSDGRLLVAQELRSEGLSAPLRFESVYRREDGAGTESP